MSTKTLLVIPKAPRGGPQPGSPGPFDFSKQSGLVLRKRGRHTSETSKPAAQKLGSYCLCSFHNAPAWLQDNQYVHDGYRANISKRDAALSIFRLHNETINIWTHLLGFLFFLGLGTSFAWNFGQVAMPSAEDFRLDTTFDKLDKKELGDLLEILHKCENGLMGSAQPVFESAEIRLPLANTTYFTLRRLLTSELDGDVSWSEQDRFLDLVELQKAVGLDAPGDESTLPNLLYNFYHHLAPADIAAREPLYLFLGGVMICLFLSTFCHTFHCVSRQAASIIWRLDYIGIVFLITCSFLPFVSYTFQCLPLWRFLYFSFIILFGSLCLMVITAERFQKAGTEGVRAKVFTALGLFGVIPILHQAFFVWQHPPPALYEVMWYEASMAAVHMMGGLLFAYRFPERLFPGKFDMAMQSHNIFHTLVVLASYVHYQGMLKLLQWRDHQSCSIDMHMVFNVYL